ncbi:MAG: hypothetical protein MI810_15145 [Flavobacteriales bacterium]|jgi:hypothetical protein|nr:hypothetical protein [Flavobacteriales bacterium]
MKTLLLTLFLSVSIFALSEEIPKSSCGEYAGEMEAYTLLKNDVEMEIDKHEVTLVLNEEDIKYSSGTIKMTGTYEAIKEGKNEFLIKASFSNGKTVSYEMEFVLNTKKQTIMVQGKNGQPDVLLDKLED